MDDSIVKGAGRISPLEVLRTRAELSDELHFSGFCREAVIRFGIKSAPKWGSRQAEFHHILSRISPCGTGLER